MTDERRKKPSLIDRAREWVSGSVEALAELFAPAPVLVPVRARRAHPGRQGPSARDRRR